MRVCSRKDFQVTPMKNPVLLAVCYLLQRLARSPMRSPSFVGRMASRRAGLDQNHSIWTTSAQPSPSARRFNGCAP
jgi:hypothetical protein